MRKRWYGVAAATGIAAIITLGLSSPAAAWDNGTYLKVGDVVCTDQYRSDISARFYGTVLNGSATVTIRIASTAGGPEKVVWSLTGNSVDFNQTVSAPTAGTYFRGCVEITRATSNTWTKMAIWPTGPNALIDIGPHIAVLSPGAGACGDGGMDSVRMVGSATAPVTWTINGTDLDYAFVGRVFTVTGSSVDETFVAGPDLSLLDMCVTNTSSQRVTVSFELID